MHGVSELGKARRSRALSSAVRRGALWHCTVGHCGAWRGEAARGMARISLMIFGSRDGTTVRSNAGRGAAVPGVATRCEATRCPALPSGARRGKDSLMIFESGAAGQGGAWHCPVWQCSARRGGAVHRAAWCANAQNGTARICLTIYRRGKALRRGASHGLAMQGAARRSEVRHGAVRRRYARPGVAQIGSAARCTARYLKHGVAKHGVAVPGGAWSGKARKR